MTVVSKPQVSHKKAVAVCLKGLDYQTDFALRLLEWFEAQFLFGADTIGVYTYFLGPSTRKVLEHYEREGKISVVSRFSSTNLLLYCETS
ncbi:unnamed protein product [Caenorhabditis auriculariae]|uniref:Glycosyltransferase family 92 protein n=1 Tax=Caenorhabditis auriculariae TaxID=2777116 RepID=A0A8S1HY58_9PELO|nr:unnamed protein product [Caenorhabditis auriculariae]